MMAAVVPFEGALTQHLLSAYYLQPECVRLDSTTTSGCWKVTEDGLFQFGPSTVSDKVLGNELYELP
jgi:hypothetical protein